MVEQHHVSVEPAFLEGADVGQEYVQRIADSHFLHTTKDHTVHRLRVWLPKENYARRTSADERAGQTVALPPAVRQKLAAGGEGCPSPRRDVWLRSGTVLCPRAAAVPPRSAAHVPTHSRDPQGATPSAGSGGKPKRRYGVIPVGEAGSDGWASNWRLHGDWSHVPRRGCGSRMLLRRRIARRGKRVDSGRVRFSEGRGRREGSDRGGSSRIKMPPKPP